MEQLLTINEVTSIFQVSRQTIYNWVKAGRLKAYKPGGGPMRFKVGDIEDLLQSGSTLGANK